MPVHGAFANDTASTLKEEVNLSLLYTEQQDNNVSDDSRRKPQIILDYNKTKLTVVDTRDIKLRKNIFTSR